MLRISRKTDYAVRVMMAFSQQAPGNRLASAKIENEMLVPGPFLHRSVARLAQAGLIETFTGPRGGIQLAQPAEEISLRDIWVAIEGPLVVCECIEAYELFGLSSTCSIRWRWGRLQEIILKELDQTNLAELAHEAQAAAVYN